MNNFESFYKIKRRFLLWPRCYPLFKLGEAARISSPMAIVKDNLVPIFMNIWSYKWFERADVLYVVDGEGDIRMGLIVSDAPHE